VWEREQKYGEPWDERAQVGRRIVDEAFCRKVVEDFLLRGIR
jgi:hypothetical protein